MAQLLRDHVRSSPSPPKKTCSITADRWTTSSRSQWLSVSQTEFFHLRRLVRWNQNVYEKHISVSPEACHSLYMHMVLRWRSREGHMCTCECGMQPVINVSSWLFWHLWRSGSFFLEIANYHFISLKNFLGAIFPPLSCRGRVMFSLQESCLVYGNILRIVESQMPVMYPCKIFNFHKPNTDRISEAAVWSDLWLTQHEWEQGRSYAAMDGIQSQYRGWSTPWTGLLIQNNTFFHILQRWYEMKTTQRKPFELFQLKVGFLGECQNTSQLNIKHDKHKNAWYTE